MRPIILDYAIERTGDDTPLFTYSGTQSLNIITTKEGEIPFIDIDQTFAELLTKTKIQREQDDECLKLFELATKTEVQRERDDHHHTILELTSKTFVQRERDDEDPFIN